MDGISFIFGFYGFYWNVLESVCTGKETTLILYYLLVKFFRVIKMNVVFCNAGSGYSAFQGGSNNQEFTR